MRSGKQSGRGQRYEGEKRIWRRGVDSSDSGSRSSPRRPSSRSRALGRGLIARGTRCAYFKNSRMNRSTTTMGSVCVVQDILELRDGKENELPQLRNSSPRSGGAS